MSAESETVEQVVPNLSVKPRWRTFSLRALVSIALLAPFLFFLHPADLAAAMKKTGFMLWGFTVASAIIVHVILAAKWRMLLHAAGNKAGRMDALRAHGAGLFANICLPSLIGGDFVRTGMVTRDTKHLPSAITGVVADRVTDVASLIVLATIGMLLLPAVTNSMEVRVLTIVAVLLTAGVFATAVVIRRINPTRFPDRIAPMVDGLKQALEAMSRQKASTLLAVIITISTQGLFIFQNALIASAVGIHVPVAVWLVAFPLAKLVAFLPVSLGGLGVREGVVVAVLLPFSVPATLAIAQSLVWQTVTFATGLAGGLAALWIGRQRSKPQA